MSEKLTIGKVAELSGVPRKTIRFYEEVGLIPPAHRSENGYRLYTGTDLRRLELIRRARMLDIGLSEVRSLVQVAEVESCNDLSVQFLDLVHKKLKDVDQRIEELQALKADLRRLQIHLQRSPREEGWNNHTALECSPATCHCWELKETKVTS